MPEFCYEWSRILGQGQDTTPHYYTTLITAVKTKRLLFNKRLLKFKAATYCVPEYFQQVMLLAFITGQRRADIARMHSSHVWEGYLHIEEQKKVRELP